MFHTFSFVFRKQSAGYYSSAIIFSPGGKANRAKIPNSLMADFLRKKLHNDSPLLVTFLPALFGFIWIPLDLYIPNQNELDHNLAVLLPYLACAALWMIGCTL